MKATGITRKMDELGRVVIPMQVRKKLKIKEKDSMEIYIDGSSIILKKSENSCVFCGNITNIKTYKDKLVCKSCIDRISKLK